MLGCGASTPVPTVTFTATPASVSPGQSATISWQTTNATAVTIEGLGTVAANGSQTVTPTQTTIYHLTAQGPGGTTASDATVTLGPPLKVVFIGDSMLGGSWGGTNLQAVFPQYIAMNEGIGGNTTAQMLARFQTDVVDLHPDAVLIWGSFNGLGAWLTPQDIENNWTGMINQARNAGIAVVMCTIVPSPTPRTDILEANDWLRSYVSANGIAFADFYAVLAGPDGLLRSEYNQGDGHLNDAGHASLVAPATKAIEQAARQAGK
jgi:lysophospholipase L1-like esterase